MKNIKEVLLTEIHPHPANPRSDEWNEGALTELMRSIEENGVTNTPILRELDEGKYEIVSGHRRIRACRQLGYISQSCEIRDLNDDETLMVMMTENMFREDLNPVEEAEAYHMMCERLQWSAQKVADAMGIKVKTVERKQALLNLPVEVKAGIADRRVSLAVADLLVSLPEVLLEEGSDLIMSQLEIEGVSPAQAKDLLKYQVLQPYEQEREWVESSAERMSAAYVEAKKVAMMGTYDDPLIVDGKYSDKMPASAREALVAVDVHQRAEGQDESLLWLHVAQRHNLGLQLVPYPSKKGWLLVVDSEKLVEAEKAIADARAGAQATIDDPDSRTAAKEQAIQMLELVPWLIQSRVKDAGLEIVEPVERVESNNEVHVSGGGNLPDLSVWLEKDLAEVPDAQRARMVWEREQLGIYIESVISLKGKEWA